MKKLQTNQTRKSFNTSLILIYAMGITVMLLQMRSIFG